MSRDGDSILYTYTLDCEQLKFSESTHTYANIWAVSLKYLFEISSSYVFS